MRVAKGTALPSSNAFYVQPSSCLTVIPEQVLKKGDGKFHPKKDCG